jgi:two-component sensor histidine kinase
MKNIFLLITFLFSFCFCFSQNDSNTVITLQKKLEVFQNNNQLDSVLFYEKQVLIISTKINYKRGIAHALGSLGLVYKYKGDYSKALNYFFKSLADCEKLDDKLGSIINLGNIGTVYDAQGDFPKALDYYFKALKISESINDKHTTSIQYHNIANLYGNQAMISKSEEYHFKALAIDKSLNDKKGIATTLMDLGSLYSLNDSLQKSLTYYLEALSILEEIGNKVEIGTCLMNISAGYTDLRQKKKAEEYLLKTFSLSKEIDDVEFKESLEKMASQIYAEFDNYKEAFTHYENYIILRDSIFNELNTKQSMKAELDYEFDKKQAITKYENDKIIYRLESENKLHKQLRIFFIIYIILILGLLFFAKRAFDNKKRVADFMASENERKEMLLQEVHHRINNNLQIISSLLTLQANSVGDEKLNNYLMQSQNRIQSLSVLHELLYQNDSSLQININEYLNKVLDFHRDVLSPGSNKVDITLNITDVCFPTKTAVPLALIVNELVTNSIKYAFNAANNGQINISLLPIENEKNKWKLSVSDSGKGLPMDTNFRKDSLGLRLVTIMVKQIKGDLIKSNTPGATFEIFFNA